jgi:[CysO sulfur-carrier protein]-S-L-cysteine hydrolase
MTQWIHGNLRIERNALAVVEAAAVAAYSRDEEACGYITGPESDALLCSDAIELENLANKYHAIDPAGHPRTGREYFKINSLKFEKALNAGADVQKPVKVFFHSHLDCGAYFSQEDAASMTNGGKGDPAYALSYLVTAVDEGKVTAHKLFVWQPSTRTFVESPFTIVG